MQKMQLPFLTYALNKDGNLVHIDEVNNGIKCACYCPHCRAPLIAKNAGTQRNHHFAHTNVQECEGAFESSLHLLAKEILQEAGMIMLPLSIIDDFPSGAVHIHDVEVEKWDERYGIRPDAEGIMDNGERLLIEIYVSHKVDYKKRKIIIDNHLKCIEINLNRYFQSEKNVLDEAKLKEFLIDTDKEREWIIPIPVVGSETGLGLHSQAMENTVTIPTNLLFRYSEYHFNSGRYVDNPAAASPLAGRTVVYSSEDASVATVDASGRITAVGVGTTRIKAFVPAKTSGSTVYRSATDWCNVTVKFFKKTTPKTISNRPVEHMSDLLKDYLNSTPTSLGKNPLNLIDDCTFSSPLCDSCKCFCQHLCKRVKESICEWFRTGIIPPEFIR